MDFVGCTLSRRLLTQWQWTCNISTEISAEKGKPVCSMPGCASAGHRRLPSATQILCNEETLKPYITSVWRNQMTFSRQMSRLSECVTCGLCQTCAPHCNVVVAQSPPWSTKRFKMPVAQRQSIQTTHFNFLTRRHLTHSGLATCQRRLEAEGR